MSILFYTRVHIRIFLRTFVHMHRPVFKLALERDLCSARNMILKRCLRDNAVGFYATMFLNGSSRR